MTREKALQAMDTLVAMGYGVSLYEHDLGDRYVAVAPDGERTSIVRRLEIHELSLDKIDLRSLLDAADELELEVGLSALGQGRVTFEAQPKEDERRRRSVVSPRRHPR